MKNNIGSIHNCITCCACSNICPKDAISLCENNAFYNVVINNELCVSCGLCLSVCPQNNGKSIGNPIKTYGLYNKNKDKLKHSSSGGFFVELAEYILNKEGVVFAAGFSDNNQVIFKRITSFKDIDQVLKSKYVESAIGMTFREILTDLNKGTKVLFCGSPCQVAGLKLFLKKDYENLVTCDFACGGFSSHLVFNKYLNDLSKIYKSSVKNVDFRPKTFGWRRHSISITFNNNKKYEKLAELDPYFYSFLYTRYSIKKECLDCNFTDKHSSDFTMADFWKWKEYSNIRNRDQGISLIQCNSEKSIEIIKSIIDFFENEEVDLEKTKYNFLQKPKMSKEFYISRERFLDVALNKSVLDASIDSGMKTGINAIIHKFKVRIKMMMETKNEK